MSELPPDTLNEIGVLRRREIEARILMPVLERLGAEFGEERVFAIARDVIIEVARDFSLVEGFNPDIALTRTQTIMQGASHCDFRFVARPAKTSPGG